MPVRGEILYCSNCDKPQPKINLISCVYCGSDLGAPNVNEISTDTELGNLANRYHSAKQYCNSTGNTSALFSFENFFNKNCQAVINMSFSTLKSWILGSGYYKSYYRSVEENLRLIANPADDKKRGKIDSNFFGFYHRDIIFAALSLNSIGLNSYGDCVVILNEDSIKLRTSTLEENTYDFIKTHKLDLETIFIPPGYRSIWNDKLKLAVSKCFSKIVQTSSEEDFVKFVLFSNGNRSEDKFIELHIYKELTLFSIKEIIIPNFKDSSNIIFAKAIEEKLPGKIKKSVL